MKLERLPQRPLPPAPVAPAKPHVLSLFGTEVGDPYAWLKAENWRAVLKDPGSLPPDIRAHLDAENAYAAAALEGTEGLRERLVKEMRGRIKEDDSSVPQPDGPYAYFTRFREGGQHPLIGRQPRESGPETILLDGDGRARDLRSSISAERSIHPIIRCCPGAPTRDRVFHHPDPGPPDGSRA